MKFQFPLDLPQHSICLLFITLLSMSDQPHGVLDFHLFDFTTALLCVCKSLHIFLYSFSFSPINSVQYLLFPYLHNVLELFIYDPNLMYIQECRTQYHFVKSVFYYSRIFSSYYKIVLY